MASLLSVNAGTPRDVAWRGRTVTTSIWKHPIAGAVTVGRLGVEGDQQSDLVGHGGEFRALMVYQIESYRFWERHLGRPEFPMTVSGLPDDEVCVGDRYRIGEVVVEVTQPRVTCFKVGIRMNEDRMPALLVQHRRPGFYFRVIRQGRLKAGDEIVKIADGPGQMPVTEIDALLYSSEHPAEKLERALRIGALSPGWRKSFEALLEASSGASTKGNAGLSPQAAAPAPAWSGFRELEIAEVNDESGDVRSIVLASRDGDALPDSLPGQYLTVRVRPDPGEPAAIRSYSLCGPSPSRTYRLGIKREGSISQFIHQRLKAGDLIEAAAPRGSFVLGQEDAPVVLLSAGIGLTPTLAMLQSETAKAPSRRRPLWWIHAARDSDHHPFSAEVRRLIAQSSGACSITWYSRPLPGDTLGRDYDVEGHLTVAALSSMGVPMTGFFYLCGPARFSQALVTELVEAGVSADRIRTENFGPSVAGLATGSKAPHQPEGEPGEGPSVRFLRSGLSVRWSPRFSSLLELCEACDVPARWSCRSGVCHNCECLLVDGELGYTTEPLDPPPAGHALICCSVPKSDVVLEL